MAVATNHATGDLITATDINALASQSNANQSAIQNLALTSGSMPYRVQPSSSTTDIGPLINSALQTYGVAIVSPRPGGAAWTLNTPILIGTGESLIGLGRESSHIQCGSGFPSGGRMVSMRTGSSAGCTIRGMKLGGNNRAASAIYMNATASPDGSANTAPDFVHIIEDVHSYGMTGDGFYVGGTGAYGGNCRESRIRNCLSSSAGGWGFTISSSDMFISDCTAHGSGPGGFRTISGQSGNAKFWGCKAYFETVGIQSDAVRVTISGGEVQDCSQGIIIGSDSYVNTTIDSCGDGTRGALRINGSGSTFAVHMTSRILAGQPSTMQYALQIGSNGSNHGGFINTNVATGAYANTYLGANRPANPLLGNIT